MTKFGIFKKELTDLAIPIHLRPKLFDAVVTPTLLHVSEVWTMTLQLQKQLRTDAIRWKDLTTAEQELVDAFANNSLHLAVNKANEAYGFNRVTTSRW